MRNTLGKLCIILTTLLLLFSVGFYTVSLVLRDEEYIEDKYKSLGVGEQLGMSTPDLSAATDVLFSYMRGERANIRFAARVNGADLDDIFYHEKEVVHMAEVQMLWFNLSSFAGYGLLGAAVLLILGLILIAPGSRRRVFAGGVIWGAGIFGGILAFMGIWAVLNFNSFWTVFHFLIFPSSLFQYLSAGATPEALNSLNWVLDENCIMIKMLMPIFPSLVLRCAVLIVIEIAVVLLFGIILLVAGRKKLPPAVAELITVEHDANEPVEIEGPDLVLSHQLRNAPVSKREALKRRAETDPKPAPESVPEADAQSEEDPILTIADRSEPSQSDEPAEAPITEEPRQEPEKESEDAL